MKLHCACSLHGNYSKYVNIPRLHTLILHREKYSTKLILQMQSDEAKRE